MEIIVVLLPIFVIFLLLYVIYVLLYSMILGAPYAATRVRKMNMMLDLLKLTTGDKFVDLGSGDGRFVIEAAKKGVNSYGYEMNPILVIISRNKIKNEKLPAKAKIFWKSYWSVNLGEYNAVAVFGIKHIMPSLSKKLKNELKEGSRVVSNHFRFPNWKESEKKENLYLYKRSEI